MAFMRARKTLEFCLHAPTVVTLLLCYELRIMSFTARGFITDCGRCHLRGMYLRSSTGIHFGISHFRSYNNSCVILNLPPLLRQSFTQLLAWANPPVGMLTLYSHMNPGFPKSGPRTRVTCFNTSTVHARYAGSKQPDPYLVCCFMYRMPLELPEWYMYRV